MTPPQTALARIQHLLTHHAQPSGVQMMPTADLRALVAVVEAAVRYREHWEHGEGPMTEQRNGLFDALRAATASGEGGHG